jgi:SAM-dependent methyltransferase
LKRQAPPPLGERPGRVRQVLTEHLGSIPNQPFHCYLCGSTETPALLSVSDNLGVPVRVVMCARCAFVATLPRVTTEFLDWFYDGPYWDLIGALTGPEDHHKETSRGRDILEFVSRTLPGWDEMEQPLIVELGCGSGVNLVPFKEHGAKVLGFDADARTSEVGAAWGLELRQQDVRHPDFGGLVPDLVILAHVLEHLEDPRETLVACRQAMNGKGWLYVEVPGLWNLSNPSYGQDLLKYWQVAHTFHFEERTLEILLHQAGWEVVAIDARVGALARPGNGGCTRDGARSLASGLAQAEKTYVKRAALGLARRGGAKAAAWLNALRSTLAPHPR